MNKIKGGRLPKLADNLGFIQIKKVKFSSIDKNVDDIINTFLFKNKEIERLKSKLIDIISKEMTDDSIKNNIIKEMEVLINSKTNTTVINEEIIKNIIKKSVEIIFGELYKFDENFKNDANEKFICDKSVGNEKMSVINVTSNDLNSLNSLNKGKINQYVKILLYKIISGLSDNEKDNFEKELSKITGKSRKIIYDSVFKKLNLHNNKLFRFVYSRNQNDKGNLLNIYN
jgi:hypothetical protein